MAFCKGSLVAKEQPETQAESFYGCRYNIRVLTTFFIHTHVYVYLCVFLVANKVSSAIIFCIERRRAANA